MSTSNYRVQLRYLVKINGLSFNRMDTIFIPIGHTSESDAYVNYILNFMRPRKCEGKIFISEIQQMPNDETVITPMKIFSMEDDSVIVEYWDEHDNKYSEGISMSPFKAMEEMKDTLLGVKIMGGALLCL